jgi:hypothetical protein
MNYMCTLNCSNCEFTPRIHIEIHSKCFKDSIVLSLRNQLLLIICIIVNYFDTGNVFKVFRSYKQEPSSKEINIIQVQDLRLIRVSIVPQGF